jgi:hypothetical protein
VLLEKSLIEHSKLDAQYHDDKMRQRMNDIQEQIKHNQKRKSKNLNFGLCDLKVTMHQMHSKPPGLRHVVKASTQLERTCTDDSTELPYALGAVKDTFATTVT